MRILLLSAYDAVSHRHWREGLVRHLSEDQFTQLSLPARFFSWRVRGNSLSWAFGQREPLQREYDLLLATSLVDLSALRGFLPALGRIPTVVYFHENQFAYPASVGQRASVEPQIVNLYTALCADTLLFNSRWNRDSFLQGVAGLLARLPDHVPAGLPGRLAERAQVLPVPVEIPDLPARHPGSVLNVVWNHRWEYDKGPAILLAAVEQCVRRRLPLRFHVLGQQFKRRPAEFEQLAGLLRANPAMAGHFGFVEGEHDYRSVLDHCDVVLSTALHEFQGLAVMEAVARGCLPLVPDRLSYPEFIPEACRYPSTPQDSAAEGRAIADRLQQLSALAAGSWPVAPDLRAFDWLRLAPEYRRIMVRCAADGLRSDRQ